MGVVGCKLPNGLVIEHADHKLTLVGSNAPGSIGGYGLTYGVDIDWFSDWMTGPAREFPPVTKGLIFIAGNDSNAADQAKEQAAERTGLEGVDPDNPAPGIEPTEETKAELAKQAAKPPGK